MKGVGERACLAAKKECDFFFFCLRKKNKKKSKEKKKKAPLLFSTKPFLMTAILPVSPLPPL